MLRPTGRSEASYKLYSKRTRPEAAQVIQKFKVPSSKINETNYTSNEEKTLKFSDLFKTTTLEF